MANSVTKPTKVELVENQAIMTWFYTWNMPTCFLVEFLSFSINRTQKCLGQNFMIVLDLDKCFQTTWQTYQAFEILEVLYSSSFSSFSHCIIMNFGLVIAFLLYSW